MPRELTPLETRWIGVEKKFRRDVAVTTQFLFYQLDAIHSLHRRTRELQATAGSGTVPAPAYPPLRGRLFVAGTPLSEQAAPDGPMEEAAFRSWVVEVYRLWETRHRVAHERAAHPDVPDAIRPEVDPLGDLRRIRNDMLHKGVATKANAANCKVLRWFKEEERVQVRLRHVLDFLNQMGWLTETPVSISDGLTGQVICWHIGREGWDGNVPPLVSVRPMLDADTKDLTFRYGASVVFGDGVFGCISFAPGTETPAETEKRSRLWPTMRVSGNGSLVLPGFDKEVSAGTLYRRLLKSERTARPTWGPAMRFRRWVTGMSSGLNGQNQKASGSATAPFAPRARPNDRGPAYVQSTGRIGSLKEEGA